MNKALAFLASIVLAAGPAFAEPAALEQPAPDQSEAAQPIGVSEQEATAAEQAPPPPPEPTVTKEFGSDFFRFSVAIPESWESSDINGGCVLRARDGSASLSIQFFNSGNKDVMTYAKALAANMKARIIKIEHSKAANEAIIYCKLGVARVKISVAVQYGVAMVTSASGGDPQQMQDIISSIKQVKRAVPEQEGGKGLEITDSRTKKD